MMIKKILLPLILLAAPAFAAQQEITAVPDSPVLPSIGALKDAVNPKLLDIDENFDEIYPIIEAGPVYVNASAPADTKVVWIDTDQDNAIKAYIGGVWTVVGSGGEGSYTLPTAAADTLGGVKVGARLTITDGVLSADVQAGGESTTVGDGTTGPYLDGTVDGGTLIKLSAPSGGNGTWTSLQGGNPTANRNWRLPIDAPPAAGTTRLINVDENTQMGLVDPATFLTPTGSADLLTVTDTGSYFTTDTVGAALQELGGAPELLFGTEFTETAGTGTVTVTLDYPVTSETYGSGWSTDTEGAQRDDIYAILHVGDTDDDGMADKLDLASAGFVKVNDSGVISSVKEKEYIGWSVVSSDTATAIADGKLGAAIPAGMNGMNLVDFNCSVADLNSAASGATTVVLRRVRGGTAADMTSTGVTIEYGDYTASDEVIDTSNDDLATGDKLYVDINAVTTAAQKGLHCTATFEAP